MKFSILLIVFAATVALGVIVLFASVELRESSDFCVSCHLKDGSALHGPKNREMKATPPVNLASLHFHLPRGESTGCFGCHQGVSMEGKLEVMSLEAANTFKYFFGSFKEPEKADFIPEDILCGQCHEKLRSKARKYGFHTFEAHEGLKEYRCADCHEFHKSGEEERGFIDMEAMIVKCEKCHQQAEFSPFIRKSLGLGEADSI